MTLILLLACTPGDDTATASPVTINFHTQEIACHDADHTAWWYPPDGLILIQAFLQTDTGQLPQAVGMLTPGTEYPFWCQFQGHSGTEYGDSVVVTWGVE